MVPVAGRIVTAALCLLALLAPPAAGQDGDMPFDPDSVHRMISPVSRELVDAKELPSRLSVAEWQADLDTLAAAIRRRIPYAGAATGGSVLSRRLDSLKSALPGMTRDQRILAVMRLLNLPAPGTGHTGIRTSQRALRWRAVPLHPYRFADGVYVMSAADPGLIGSEVLSVGRTPIDSVYKALAPYVSADNRWDRMREVEEWAIQFLWAHPLRALEILDRVDEVPLRVRVPSGDVRRVSVETSRPDTRAYVRFLVSDSTRPDTPPGLQWSPATIRQDNGEPNYRLSYRDSTDLLYLQFNTVANASDDWTVADLADSLRHVADTRPLEKVVVDLRTNNGGNANLVGPLVDVLARHPKIDRRGVLYTLISPVTYSAAGLFAMELERRTETLFAGEPGGFAPKIWGQTEPVVLPNSRITAKISFSYNQTGLPGSPRTHLEPDLHVPMTSGQHFSNVDSTMIAVRRHEPAHRRTVTLRQADRERFAGTYRLSPIHVVRVTDTDDGLHLRITGEALNVRLDEPGPAVFLESELHPLSAERLATDVSDVFVERPRGQDGLTLAWHDTTYALTPVDPATKPPIERIRDGDLAGGIAELQAVRESGAKLGTNIVSDPFLAEADRLLGEGRGKEALRYARAAETFYPRAWRVQAYLAEIHRALGRTGDACRALEEVESLHPARADDLRARWGLERTPGPEGCDAP